MDLRSRKIIALLSGLLVVALALILALVLRSGNQTKVDDLAMVANTTTTATTPKVDTTENYQADASASPGVNVAAAADSAAVNAATSPSGQGSNGNVQPLSMSISPTPPCLHGSIAVSGTGMAPNVEVIAMFGGQDLKGVVLGSTHADANGNWTLTAPVPASLVSEGGNTVPVRALAGVHNSLPYYVTADDVNKSHQGDFEATKKLSAEVWLKNCP